MTGWNTRFRSDFVPEWCALGALVLLTVLWLSLSPVAFTAKTNDFVFLALGPCAILALRGLGIRKGGLIAEHFSLMLLLSTTICVLSYLCVAASGPLADPRLMAMDRALGFDWLASYRFVDAHPGLKRVLEIAYGSPVVQSAYFSILLGLMDRKDRLRDMFWLFGCGGLLACLGGLLLPALGPSKFFGLDASFVPVMEHLLSGRDLTFNFSGMTGVVSFPSFHTTMALVFVWGFRGTGPIGWLIAGVNLVMLCAVPYFGGHYLMDMIAGAAVMPLSLAMVRGAPNLQKLRIGGGRAAALPA
jgi:hypothetical protein